MQQNEVRTAILHAEMHTEAMLRASFRQTQHRLVPAFVALRDRLQAMRKQDGTYPVHALTKATKEPIQHAIMAEVIAFSHQARTLTGLAQLAATRRGIQTTTSQMRAKTQVIHHAKIITPQPIVKPARNAAMPGSAVYLLYTQFAGQSTDRATKSLTAGIVANNDPSVIATALQMAVTIALTRALVIARTESMQSYRSGASLVFQVNSTLISGWIWRAQPGACPECLAMDGSVHDADEEMVGLHPNCRCYADPIIQQAAQAV